MNPDWTLHMLVPASASLFPVVEAAVRGGVTVVQLRGKGVSDGELYDVGRGLRDLCRRTGAAFFVNDRPDLALLLGADGVHLGQRDLPPAAVRALLPAGMRLGISTHTVGQAVAAERIADYVAFGPVFATDSKEDADPVTGLKALAEVCRTCRKPVVAIGGVAAANKDRVWKAGVSGIACIGALLRAADPKAAAQTLLP